MLKFSANTKEITMKIVQRFILAQFVWISLLPAQNSPNVPLLAHVNDYPSVGYNDCWGYTAPDGREYAFLGVRNGTSILDITDTDNVYEVTFISSANSTWKDIKTYQNYAYTVTEAAGGLQIIDLSNLPASAELVTTSDILNTSHNIFIDEDNGILYSDGEGSSVIRVVSLADPLNPVQISSFGIECHDIYVQDDIAYISEGSSGSFGIYDVSNPESPAFIERIDVPAAGYCHNAWTTEDGHYLMTTEETVGKTIKFWDIQDMDNINMTSEYLGPNNFAHNTHIKGEYAYISHYESGMRIVDISDPYNIFEVGYYETQSNWGAYPFFASGKVLISDMSNGLYVVYFEGALDADVLDPQPVENLSAYSDYTTPSSMTLEWTDPSMLINGDPIPEFSVVIHRDEVFVAEIASGVEAYVDQGLVDGQLYSYDVLVQITENDSLSFISSTDWICGGSPVPSSPEDFTGSEEEGVVTLSWTNPTTQIDGTPLDDLASIFIYRNGNYFTEMATTEAGAEMNWQDEPEFGFSYDYQVMVVDNESDQNESDISELHRFWVGDIPEFLIWNPDNVSPSSATVISRSFYELGRPAAEVQELTEFGGDLYATGYKAIFVLCGFYPNSYEIWDGQWGTQGDLFRLGYYLNDGGSIYMEAGDEFSNMNAATVTELFNVGVSSQGGYNLNGIVGVEGTFSEEMMFDYDGDAAGIDQLIPLESAFPVFVNTGVPFFTGVANDGGDYRTLAATFEIGGLVEGEINHSLLLDSIIHFLVDADDLSVNDPIIPEEFSLSQNYPNPFNPATAIHFNIPEAGDVELVVYDIMGRKVEVLVNGIMVSGEHQIEWDASDFASGIYMYKLTSSGETLSKRMILLK